MNENKGYQRLDEFKLPRGFRGRFRFHRPIWWIRPGDIICLVAAIYVLAGAMPLLRLFGARIGNHVQVRATFVPPTLENLSSAITAGSAISGTLHAGGHYNRQPFGSYSQTFLY